MNGPFDPRKEAPLLSAYVDGELGPDDVARIDEHLAANPETARELAKLRQLKDLTGHLRLKEPPPEEWETFWRSVYNRTERSLGWLLLLIGMTAVAAWTFYQLLMSLLAAENIPMLMRVAILIGTAGLLILLISVVRERVYKRGRTRYKDVVR